jgi:signal transduction histidine kinase
MLPKKSRKSIESRLQERTLTDLLERRKTLHRKVEDFESRFAALTEQVENLQPLANLGLNWAMTAHEMNNLLMPIGNYARLALDHPEDADLRQKSLEKVLKLSERAALVMEKVMSLANPGKTEPTRLDIAELFEDVFTCIGRDFSKERIHVIRQIDKGVTVFAEKTSIEQVLLNLILNARQALSSKGGVLRIGARQVDDQVLIDIADNGCGIDPDQLKNVFTPFYTQGKANGRGLGLAFCQKVIESHGGFISVESERDQGTRFRISLPNESA